MNRINTISVSTTTTTGGRAPAALLSHRFAMARWRLQEIVENTAYEAWRMKHLVFRRPCERLNFSCKARENVIPRRDEAANEPGKSIWTG